MVMLHPLVAAPGTSGCVARLATSQLYTSRMPGSPQGLQLRPASRTRSPPPRVPSPWSLPIKSSNLGAQPPRPLDGPHSTRCQESSHFPRPSWANPSTHVQPSRMRPVLPSFSPVTSAHHLGEAPGGERSDRLVCGDDFNSSFLGAQSRRLHEGFRSLDQSDCVSETKDIDHERRPIIVFDAHTQNCMLCPHSTSGGSSAYSPSRSLELKIMTLPRRKLFPHRHPARSRGPMP